MQSLRFSLRHLLLIITITACVFGFTAAFPGVASELLLYLPAIGIAIYACTRSQKIGQTLWFVGLGIVLAALFTPRMNVYYSSPPTFVDLFLTDFMTVGITTIVGAFVGYRFDAHAQKMAWR